MYTKSLPEDFSESYSKVNKSNDYSQLWYFCLFAYNYTEN